MTTIIILAGILFINEADKGQSLDSALKDTTVKKEIEAKTTVSAAKNLSYDKIYLKNGDSLVVSIKEKNVQEISYYYPLNTVMNKMRMCHIRRITYADGKEEKFVSVFDSKNIDSKNETKLYWDKVNVVFNADSVNGMTMKGVVKTVFKGDQLKEEDKTLEKSAIIILKKKTINVDADCLLITYQKIYREFGEIPYIEIEGIAYKSH